MTFYITQKEMDELSDERLACIMTADDFGQLDQPVLKRLARKYGFDWETARILKCDDPFVIEAKPKTAKPTTVKTKGQKK